MKRRYTSLCQFIFFVLLQEGKSNLPYRLYLLVCGEQFTTLHYFKKLFARCDTNTYQHYCSMYEKSNHVPLQLPKGYCVKLTDDKNRLTGELVKYAKY